METRPSPFGFSTATEFLAAWDSWAERSLRGYSRRALARWSGIASPNFFSLVLSGKRVLTGAWLKGIARGMKLSAAEARALQCLVGVEGAEEFGERLSWQQRLFDLRAQEPGTRLERDRLALVRNPLAWTLYHMLDIVDQRARVSWFVGRLRIAREAAAVREGLALLQSLGLIKRVGDRYESLEKTLVSPDQLKSLENHFFHEHALREALATLETVEPSERSFASFTATIADEDIPRLKEEVAAFARHLFATYSTQRRVKGEVMRVNLQCYPVTRKS